MPTLNKISPCCSSSLPLSHNQLIKWSQVLLGQNLNSLTWLQDPTGSDPLFLLQFSFPTAPLLLLNIMVTHNSFWSLECAMRSSL